MRFRDREEAGWRLAAALRASGIGKPAVVLAIPRGGVPLAAPVASELGAELGIIVARKLRSPVSPELAIGAVTADGAAHLDQDLALRTGADEAYVAAEVTRQVADARRRAEMYGAWARPALAGRTAVIVDDGLATGATAIAAVRSARHAGASRVILAVPVAAPDGVAALEKEADAVVCLHSDPAFENVGRYYADFRPVEDEAVLRTLEAFAAGQSLEGAGAGAPSARIAGGGRAGGPEERVRSYPAQVPVGGGVRLEGTLAVPPGARGLVVFAHGSGSGRMSPRNQQVAGALHEAGLATLLVDLLTEEEEAIDESTARFRFDLDLLADRLVAAARAVAAVPELRDLPVGCFGSSTGGGAALVAAARAPDIIRAVVSRGGRPDLAGDLLPLVRAPTLLIVGGLDGEVLRLNREALRWLPGEKRMEVVPGATHLFPEPGALEEVSRLAALWFARHLAPPAPAARSPGARRAPDREPA